MARTPIYVEVKDAAGNVVAAASVTIKKRSDGTNATWYTLESGGSSGSTTLTADANGRVTTWVDRGAYNAVITGTGITGYTIPIDGAAASDLAVNYTWQTGGVMPTGPVNGDEVYYVADATNGIVWHFKYRSASASTYKWEYIGGAYLFSEIVTAASESTASTSYVALTTAGPSLTVPLAGDYDVTLEQTAYNSTNVNTELMSYDIGGTGAVDADAVGNQASPASSEIPRAVRTRRKTFTVASTALVAKYKVGAGTGIWPGTAAIVGASRVMRVVPVRVA